MKTITRCFLLIISVTIIVSMTVYARQRMTEEEYMRKARESGLSKRERYWLRRYSYEDRTQAKLDRAIQARGKNHDAFKAAVLNISTNKTVTRPATQEYTNSVSTTSHTNCVEKTK